MPPPCTPRVSIGGGVSIASCTPSSPRTPTRANTNLPQPPPCVKPPQPRCAAPRHALKVRLAPRARHRPRARASRGRPAAVVRKHVTHPLPVPPPPAAAPAVLGTGLPAAAAPAAAAPAPAGRRPAHRPRVAG
jgi:hypothetical protein